ncbi:hypothetical protein DFAR_2910042 [Desulfarculales bacterium]
MLVLMTILLDIAIPFYSSQKLEDNAV